MMEITTQMCVPSNHPSLPGHFPGRPIVPGVVLLDLIFDAARRQLGHGTSLQSIVSAKFLRAVEPEQTIDVNIALAPIESSAALKARFVAAHAGAPVVEGSFVVALAGQVA